MDTEDNTSIDPEEKGCHVEFGRVDTEGKTPLHVEILKCHKAPGRMNVEDATSLHPGEEGSLTNLNTEDETPIYSNEEGCHTLPEQLYTDGETPTHPDEDGCYMVPEPPDGGWGWMVAAGATTVALTIPMLGPSFGILFSPVLLEWQASSTVVAVIVNGFMVIWKFTGGVVGTLTREFGFRKVGMMGTMLTAVSLTLAAASNSPVTLFICYSIGCGLGCGLSTIGFLILAQYFKKRRGLSNTFLTAGTGLGRFLSPLLIRLLQEEYGYKGATAIMGAIMLQGFVGTTLYQPVEWHQKYPNAGKDNPQDSSKRKDPLVQTGRESLQDVQGESTVLEVDKEICHNQINNTRNLQQVPILQKNEENMNNITLLNVDKGKHQNRCNNTTIDQQVPSLHKENGSSISATEKYSGINIDKGKEINGSYVAARASLLGVKEERYSSQCSYTSSKVSLEQSSLDLASLASVASLEHFFGEDNSNFKSERQSNEGETTIIQRAFHTVVRVMRAIINDLLILRYASALIIALGSTLTINGQVNFIVMVPFAIQAADHSLQVAAWGLFIAGLTNLITRICVSTLSDFPWFSMRFWYLMGMFIMTTSIIAFPFGSSELWVKVVLGVYGCGQGAFQGLNNLHMASIVGLKKLTPMFGARNIIVAIGFITIGPLVGVVRDVSGSYAVCMWVMAGLIATSMVLWLILPLALRHPKTALPSDTDLRIP